MNNHIDLSIKFPANYLTKLKKLCVEKDSCPSEIFTKVFEIFFMHETVKNDEKAKKHGE